jgi:hypothetical protein
MSDYLVVRLHDLKLYKNATANILEMIFWLLLI